MKSTIDAMKQAIECLAHSGAFSRSSATSVLRDAIAAEEAQSVEPVASLTIKELRDYEPEDIRYFGTLLVGEYQLFTHPAPAKQPLSAEREALISLLRGRADELNDSHYTSPMRKAADMLTADAQEIEELESDYTDQVLRAITAEDALKAQQVAVPQVSVGYLAMDGYLVRITELTK